MPPSTFWKPITSPHSNAAAALVLALLRGYKLLISPLFGGCCRYYPSCADYMKEAVILHGTVRGTWLGLRRLCRCHPLGGHGVDPVPHRPPSPRSGRGATRLSSAGWSVRGCGPTRRAS